MFCTMKEPLFYKELAGYYDYIYASIKDYKKEADIVDKLITKYKKSDGKELLDVACGTGGHLKHLKDKYSCMGVDASRQMLEIAKKKVKGVAFRQADMKDFKFRKKFDIITCLFSSIGYARTYSNLRKTVKNFSKHLKTGGVMIVEPWFTRDAFEDGRVNLHTFEKDDLKIARVGISRIRGKYLSELEMHFLIAEKGKPIRHYVDKNQLGLFEVDKTLEIMRNAGLKARYLKNKIRTERGVYVGVKQ